MTDDADAALAALTARVQRLEGLEAVRATWLDYCHRLDAHDYDRLADVFTEDATVEMDGLGPGLDGTYRGRETIVDGFYRRTAVPRPGAPGLRHMTGHLSTNIGDRAARRRGHHPGLLLRDRR